MSIVEKLRAFRRLLYFKEKGCVFKYQKGQRLLIGTPLNMNTLRFRETRHEWES